MSKGANIAVLGAMADRAPVLLGCQKRHPGGDSLQKPQHLLQEKEYDLENPQHLLDFFIDANIRLVRLQYLKQLACQGGPALAASAGSRARGVQRQKRFFSNSLGDDRRVQTAKLGFQRVFYCWRPSQLHVSVPLLGIQAAPRLLWQPSARAAATGGLGCNLAVH